METIFEILNNAYVLFCAIVGIYAVYLGAQNIPLSGNFWGVVGMNTTLAAAVLVAALILTLQGKTPHGPDPDGTGEMERTVYYLYAIYFVISLPGLFAIMRGNDNRNAAIFFAAVAFFNSAAAYRVGSLLAEVWK
ncbi:MAG: hypothetical protein K8I82_05695 [Anaerolineae bacterium]|jgi:hypothetical protein|nr:hypothetical protein [Anaerolineae bacterium]